MLGSVEDIYSVYVTYFAIVICEAKGEKALKLVKLDLNPRSTIISFVNLGQVSCFSEPKFSHLLQGVVIRDYTKYAKYTMASQ